MDFRAGKGFRFPFDVVQIRNHLVSVAGKMSQHVVILLWFRSVNLRTEREIPSAVRDDAAQSQLEKLAITRRPICQFSLNFVAQHEQPLQWTVAQKTSGKQFLFVLRQLVTVALAPRKFLKNPGGEAQGG